VEFHLVAIYSSPITGFTCTGMLIEELTSDHPPQTITITNFQNFSTLGCCSSSPPPPGKTRVLFCTVPLQTFGFHNTKYRVTAYFSYRIQQPPGQQPPGQQPPPPVTGSTSIVIEFENLIVNANPKILKWDPDNPGNRDTTFSYTLSSAQKKNCQVTIDIYNLDAVYDNNGNPNPVFETTLNQLCPGTYTFTWDGTLNKVGMPSPTIAPRGLYAFDIKVQGACPYDADRMRSSYLKISGISIAPQAFCPCFDEITNIGFNLSENTLGNVAVMKIFNKMKEKEKDMKEIANFTKTVSPGQNSWQWDGKNQKGIKLTVGKEGGYGHKRPSPNEPFWYRDFCIVVEATDTHKDYKSHQPKPAIPIGITGRIYSNIVKGAREDICFKYGNASGKKVCTDVVYDALLSANINLRDKDKVDDSYRWAPSVYAYFKNHGYLVSQPYCIGDIIFMRFKKDGPYHVGIITAVDENTGKIKAVVHASSTKNHVWEQPGNPYPKDFQVGRHPKP